MAGLMRRLVRRLPPWVRKQPISVMAAVFGIPAGVTSLFGQARSAALAELLPWWAGKMWALCLAAGCAAWLAGLSSTRQINGQLVVERLALLLLGLRLLSMAAAVYGAALIITSGWAGLLAAWPLMVLALGLTVHLLDLADSGPPSSEAPDEQ